jgi:hypothetical protein
VSKWGEGLKVSYVVTSKKVKEGNTLGKIKNIHEALGVHVLEEGLS